MVDEGRPPGARRRFARSRKVAAWGAGAALTYLVLAYVILPRVWTHYEHQRGIEGRPMTTQTAQGIPGDPLNVGLVGDERDLLSAMQAAGWFPATAVTLRSSIAIIGSVLFDRPDPRAPVSPLYYDGRQEDFAFEKPVGVSADRRRHVRFWRVLERGAEGRPVWLGAATFDTGVGLSHYTGQVTHHIAADIDATRDALMADLAQAQMVETFYTVSGIGPTLLGRNGEGDRYFTDGEIRFARLTPAGERRVTAPEVLDAPPLVSLKDALWQAATPDP